MEGKLSYQLVKMPLVTPFETSFGRQLDRCALIFKLEADGITAYSESVTDTDPFYSYENNSTALEIIDRYLVPHLMKLPVPGEFMEQVAYVKGHNMAKAALEMLLWDYHARIKGMPLDRYLGKSKGKAEVGISLGMEPIETTISRISNALDTGYQRIKVKIKKGKELGILGAIRDRFPDINLTADANCDYSIKDIDLLKKIDRFNLQYLEQPLGHDDLIYHAKLAKSMSTPICLDESITDLEKAQKAFEIGSGEIINIKPGRVGGLTNSLSISEVVRENGGHCWVGGMLETGIGRAFNVAMASQVNVDYAGDTSPNSKYFKKDVVLNPFTMKDGYIEANSGVGIGVEVDTNALSGYKTAEGVIKVWKM
ncbi:o-succinylbenzoate synthase [Oxyplasma meridianum]|uniref:o-succinylbenzoate synthase n=1 Tax=Oxyplasma meridianum TaxID=3073602 RepID=A0AAX4NGW7_9ARCH